MSRESSASFFANETYLIIGSLLVFTGENHVHT